MRGWRFLGVLMPYHEFVCNLSIGTEQICAELCNVYKLIPDLHHQATLTPFPCDLAASLCVALPYSGSAAHCQRNHAQTILTLSL